MFENRLVTLDLLLPLPAAGRKDFVEGCALHTSMAPPCMPLTNV